MRQGTEAVRLFEYGKVFFSQGEGRLGPGGHHGRRSRLRFRRTGGLDLFRAPGGLLRHQGGAVEDLVEGLGLKETGFSRIDPPEYKPGTGALLTVAGREVGRLGQIDDKVCRGL